MTKMPRRPPCRLYLLPSIDFNAENIGFLPPSLISAHRPRQGASSVRLNLLEHSIKYCIYLPFTVLLIIFHYSSLDISTFTLNANPSINKVFWKLSVTLDESAVYLPIPTFAPFFSDTTSAKRIFVQC